MLIKLMSLGTGPFEGVVFRLQASISNITEQVILLVFCVLCSLVSSALSYTEAGLSVNLLCLSH
jgi:hypothetical protein